MEDMYMNSIQMRAHAYGIHNRVDIQTDGEYTKCVQRECIHTVDMQMEWAYPWRDIHMDDMQKKRICARNAYRKDMLIEGIYCAGVEA